MRPNELDALVKYMKQSNHPINDFAKAARTVLDYIVNPGIQHQGVFRCEVTTIAQIESLDDGSADLLAQLDVL